MDYKTEFPDYVAIEKFVKQERLERSLYLADAIARAIIALRDAVNGFVERAHRGSKVLWGSRSSHFERSIPQD